MLAALAPVLQPIQTIAAVEIEALLDRAFGTDRQERTAYRLRIGIRADPRLSFAACEGGILAGVILCWPVALARENHPAERLILVGPVAVEPDRQRDGLGKALMARMLTVADAVGEDALVLIGDADYYGRFGFVAAPTQRWELPGPFERHRLLARLTGGRALPTDGMLGPCR